MEKVEMYNLMIEQLDNEYAETLKAQEISAGNQNEVFGQVAKNMVAEQTYQRERHRLVNLKNEATPLSSGVEKFINPGKVESKFEVDAGTSKVDNSLNPLGGKKL